MSRSRMKRELHGGTQEGELERDLPLELLVAALREPDAAHTSIADFPDQFVGPDVIARREIRRVRGLPDGPLDQKAGPIERLDFLEQGPHGVCNSRLLLAQLSQPDLARLWI